MASSSVARCVFRLRFVAILLYLRQDLGQILKRFAVPLGGVVLAGGFGRCPFPLFFRLADVIAGPFTCLRFEPTLERELVFSQLYERGETAGEGAFVGYSIAEEEAQLLLGVGGGQVEGETVFAHAECTLMEPMMTSHVIDEGRLGDRGGLVFVAEIGDELVELFARFTRQETEGTREAVAEIVAGGNGFAFLRGGSRRELGVLPVCFEFPGRQGGFAD